MNGPAIGTLIGVMFEWMLKGRATNVGRDCGTR